MIAKGIDEEKNTVDLVTDAMYSMSFLAEISNEIFRNPNATTTVKEFYSAWLRAVGAPQPKIPFSLGCFAGYMYCGLLITKENWSDLIPNEELPNLSADWGLTGVTCTAPQKANPTLQYFIRRMRNSLGHANISVAIFPSVDIQKDIHKMATWTFKDVNPQDHTDTFETTLTMYQIEMLIKKFHSIVHQNVRIKP